METVPDGTEPQQFTTYLMPPAYKHTWWTLVLSPDVIIHLTWKQKTCPNTRTSETGPNVENVGWNLVTDSWALLLIGPVGGNKTSWFLIWWAHSANSWTHTFHVLSERDIKQATFWANSGVRLLNQETCWIECRQCFLHMTDAVFNLLSF